MTVLFLIAALVLFQAYVGYPLSLVVLGLFRGRGKRPQVDGDPPTVTLVISAYNEERWMRAKIENSLALDYPRERLRIVVVSDGSTDATESITREYAGRGVELRAFPGRRGKVACLNGTIGALTSDLVVMSDANSIYDPAAIRLLVRHFRDAAVGCVCGRLTYVNPGRQAAGEGEKVYWGYEGYIKRLESGLGSLLGANGSLYAYRRRLFQPVDPLMFCDDVIPIRISIAGYLVVYDPEAFCSEETSNEGAEIRRRRRHASFGMRSMARMICEAVAAGRWLVVYEASCHRVLRWLGGPALIAAAVTTPFLPAGIRTPAALIQTGLFLLAILGGILRWVGVRPRALYLAYYVVVIHLAGLTGLIRLVMRRDTPFWEPRQ